MLVCSFVITTIITVLFLSWNQSYCKSTFHVDRKENLYLFPYSRRTSFPLSHFHTELIDEELGLKQLIFLSSYSPTCTEGEDRCYFEIEGRSFRVRIKSWKKIANEIYLGDLVELRHNVVEPFPETITDYDVFLGSRSKIVREVAIRWIGVQTPTYVNMERNSVNTDLQTIPFHPNILFTYIHIPLVRDPHDKNYDVEGSMQVFEYYFYDLERFFVDVLHSDYFEDLIWKSGMSIFSDSKNLRFLARKIAKDILKGLSHFHEHGWIHADVRTANIVLVRKSTRDEDEDEDVTFFENIGGVEYDFKLSGHIDSATTSCEKYIRGTNKTSIFLYGNSFQMSPEMVRRECYSYKHDTYALGIILYNLLVESWTCVHHADGKCYRKEIRMNRDSSYSNQNDDDQVRNFRLNMLGPYPVFPQPPSPPKSKEEHEIYVTETERRVTEFLEEIASIHDEMFDHESGDLRVLSSSDEHLKNIEEFLGEDAVDFLKLMTNRDPEKRCSAEECLSHRFLVEHNDEDVVHVNMYFDSIFMFQEMKKRIEKDVNDISHLLKTGSTREEIQKFYDPVRMKVERESVKKVFRSFSTKENELLDMYRKSVQYLVNYFGLGDTVLVGDNDEL